MRHHMKGLADAHPFLPPWPSVLHRESREGVGGGNGEKGGYSLMAPVYVGCVRSLGTFL